MNGPCGNGGPGSSSEHTPQPAEPPEALPPHPERIPDDSGWHRPAPFLVPVPARQVAVLARRRVLLHDPDGPATRYDLIAVGEPGDEPGHRADLGGHTELVPVLDVHDFHRARLEHDRGDRLRPAPIPVPLERLWVDRIYTNPDAIPDELVPPPAIIPAGRGHTDPQRTWLAHPHRPPIRRMVRGNACHGRLPVGTRATYCGAHELRQGLRVLCEPFLHDYGQPNLHGDLDEIDQPLWIQSVSCCTEPDYYRWTITGAAPDCWPVPLGALFLE